MVLKGRRSQVGSLCVTAYLHLKKGMVQPLVANVIMGLVALLRDPLVRVHVLGEDVERPFAPPQPAWLKAMQAQQAEAAAKAAEEGAADADGEEAAESEEGDDDEEEMMRRRRTSTTRRRTTTRRMRRGLTGRLLCVEFFVSRVAMRLGVFAPVFCWRREEQPPRLREGASAAFGGSVREQS